MFLLSPFPDLRGGLGWGLRKSYRKPLCVLASLREPISQTCKVSYDAQYSACQRCGAICSSVPTIISTSPSRSIARAPGLN